MNELEKKCYNFVLQCYFGDITSPEDAAIDRAYVDMASHTLKGFKKEDYKAKWKCRLKASNAIKEAIFNSQDMRQNYNIWHDKLCKKLQKIYDKKENDMLSYGQAQKWVNMTTKYLFVFSIIFKNMGDKERFKAIPEFFQEEGNVELLHIPLDRFIMQQYDISNFGPWSKMNYDQYNKCLEKIKDKKIEDELVDWGTAANEHRADDRKSYAYYVKNRKSKR